MESTPTTSPHFQMSLGYKLNGIATELILEGKYDTLELNNYTANMIQHLQKKTHEWLPTSQVTRASFLATLKIWPEKATISTSGIHVSCYKWHCVDPLIPHKAEKCQAQFDTNCNILIKCHLTIINHAINWQSVVNIIIAKEGQNRKILKRQPAPLW